MSQILLRSPRHPLPKYRARDALIEQIKRIHDRLNPRIVDIDKEILNRLLRRRRRGVIARRQPAPGRQPAACPARRGGARRRQQQELDVAGGQEARDVGALEAVDMLEVHGRAAGGRGCRGPLDLFDDVEAAVHDELVQVPRFGVEACDAVAALF